MVEAKHGSLTGSLTGSLLGGRYRLGPMLGRGGMGAVYQAVQENLGRQVAVKVLLADIAEEPEMLERFRREAEAASSLRHPNIVQVTDFGHPRGEPAFLVMELLTGESLRARMARTGPQDTAFVVSIAVQILSALAAAHAAGIVHRDLKPDNVLIVDVPGMGSLAKLLDFGIAKLTESAGYKRLTATGVLIGTPSYMAPEQLTGSPVDARSDLYALGVMMYGLLAGRLPFRGKTPTDILHSVLTGACEPLASLRPDIPSSLCSIIACAMAPLPNARFSSAVEMSNALCAQPATVTNSNITGGPPSWTSAGATTVDTPMGPPAQPALPAVALPHSPFQSPMRPWPGAVPPAPPPYANAPWPHPGTADRTLVRVLVGLAIFTAVVLIVGVAFVFGHLAREPQTPVAVGNASPAPGVYPSNNGLPINPAAAGGDTPSAYPLIPQFLGSLEPAGVDDGREIDVNSVQSERYGLLGPLEPGLRQFAALDLQCLREQGHVPMIALGSVVFSVAADGQLLNAVQWASAQRDLPVRDCIDRVTPQIRLPAPPGGVGATLSVFYVMRVRPHR